MIVLLTTLYAGLAGILIYHGLRTRQGVYSATLLAGVTWLGFLLPQIIGTIVNPELIPELIRLEHGSERTLFMANLCLAMTVLAAFTYRPVDKKSTEPPVYDYDRLFIGGLVLFGISLAGFAGLSSLTGGPVQFFSTGGAYELKWTGQTIIYNFFFKLSLPALSVCLLATLYKPTTFRYILVAATAVLPLCAIVFLGRRGHSVHTLMIIGACLYFAKGWLPSRKWTLIIAFAGLTFISIAPTYRAHSQVGGDWDEIKKIKPSETIADTFAGRASPEYVAAVSTVAGFRNSSEYGWGKTYFNAMVKNLLPRPVIGSTLQNAILMETTDFDAQSRKLYGWQRHSGTTITGIADTFREFWYFGAILFFITTWGFIRLWDLAAGTDALLPKLLYVNLIHYAGLTVTHNVQDLLWMTPYTLAYFWPIIWWAKRQPEQQPAT